MVPMQHLYWKVVTEEPYRAVITESSLSALTVQEQVTTEEAVVMTQKGLLENLFDSI